MSWWRRFETKEQQPAGPLPANVVRWHLLFHGRVQGVGFRYQATRIARELNITGWVRNCMDGTVEMEAQGTPRQLSLLLAKLRTQRYIRIERIEREEIPVRQGDRPFYPAN